MFVNGLKLFLIAIVTLFAASLLEELTTAVSWDFLAGVTTILVYLRIAK